MPRTILTDSPVRKHQKATHTRIQDIPVPEVLQVLYNDTHPDAERGLYLKAERSGKKTWVYVYYRNGKRHVKKLDAWPKMKPGGARIAARDLANKLANKEYDPIPARWSEAKRKQRALAEAARRAKKDLTLGALLEAYVAELEHRGKYEHRAIENSLRRNVETAHPDKWNTPADELTMPDFRDILATLVKAQKYREAQKVRAYLRAAYSAAINAHNDAAAIAGLRRFNIQSNPARDVAPIQKPKSNGRKEKAPRKALTVDELRAYWKRISALPVPDGAILRLHLLTGGQRLRQLCRLQVEDVDEGTIVLRDAKGRRSEEREHVVPLLPEAEKALDDIAAKPWLVSFDGGKTPADAWDVSKLVKSVAVKMLEAEETKEVFTGKIIRATVETRLTQAGVSPHTLAHLLSHGLGTLQERHYQFYDFEAEKRDALEKLRELLTAPPTDVVKNEGPRGSTKR